jgi:hypothetical protein
MIVFLLFDLVLFFAFALQNCDMEEAKKIIMIKKLALGIFFIFVLPFQANLSSSL